MAGLLTVGSIYSPRLPDLFRARSVANCGFRPRTQRRVRTGVSPVSLLALKGTITLHGILTVHINEPKIIVKYFWLEILGKWIWKREIREMKAFSSQRYQPGWSQFDPIWMMVSDF